MSSDNRKNHNGRDNLTWVAYAAFLLFLFLIVLFELLRTRLWWVYEPRVHHKLYKDRTPPGPGRRPYFGWIQKVFAYWSDEDFLVYGGVDGLAITYFLRFATDMSLFAGVLGAVVLFPVFRSGRAIQNGDAWDDDEHNHELHESDSFAHWTIQNLHCQISRKDSLTGSGHKHLDSHDDDKQGRSWHGLYLFPHCHNDFAELRFLAVVVCAWILTLRALSKLASTYQRFVHLRHWYLTSGLSPHAPAVEAQRALTVMVENVPWRLRSTVTLSKRFEHLCGAGCVHSAHIMAAGGAGTQPGACCRGDAAAVTRIISNEGRRPRGSVRPRICRQSSDSAS